MGWATDTDRIVGSVGQMCTAGTLWRVRWAGGRSCRHRLSHPTGRLVT